LPTIKNPKSPDQISKEWMDYALSQGGVCESGAISDINVEPLGPHVKGLLSSICRVNITYKTKTQNLPKSVVIKFPPERDENRSFGSNWGVYEREIRFYRELAKRSPIRVPNVISQSWMIRTTTSFSCSKMPETGYKGIK